MAHVELQTQDKDVERALDFVNTLFKDYEEDNMGFAVRLWEGTTWATHPDQEPKFTIVLNHPGAIRKMFFPPNDLSLGEAYIYGDFDVEGNLYAVFDLAKDFMNQKRGLMDRLRMTQKILRLPSGNYERQETQHEAKLNGDHHSKDRDKQAISYHYDVSNDFYKLWLDKDMVYSCGYFRSPDNDIDRAQEDKLDMICRKLRLKAGEKLLDIGCGWGGLIIHAAKHYGVEALGITLSQAQFEEANARIEAQGLKDRCKAIIQDYRDVRGMFDKIVSVGMVEHVGESKLMEYFKQAWDHLKPGGVFLSHGISADSNPIITKGDGASSFVQKYVFPDGELVPLGTTIRAAEQTSFEIIDVESLRRHYALTLRQWVNRLEANRDKALEAVDTVTYRLWRLYLTVSAYGFETRSFNLYQVLLAKPDGFDPRLPLTREDWYK